MITKKYLDNKTGNTIVLFPWSDKKIKKLIENNPERYSQMFEESSKKFLKKLEKL